MFIEFSDHHSILVFLVLYSTLIFGTEILKKWNFQHQGNLRFWNVIGLKAVWKIERFNDKIFKILFGSDWNLYDVILHSIVSLCYQIDKVKMKHFDLPGCIQTSVVMRYVVLQTRLQHHIRHSQAFSALQGHTVHVCTAHFFFPMGIWSRGQKNLWPAPSPPPPPSSVCSGSACCWKTEPGHPEPCCGCWPGFAWQDRHSCSPRRPPGPLVRILGPSRCWPQPPHLPWGNLLCTNVCMARAFPRHK